MNKTLLIFKHEFLNTIKRASFVAISLVVPVLTLLIIGIVSIVSSISSPTEPKEYKIVGYVDEVGVFDNQTIQGPIKLVPFVSKEDATEAMIHGQVAEFIVIPPDYLSTRSVQRYIQKRELETPPVTAEMIERFLHSNLLDGRITRELFITIMSPLNLDVTRLDKEGNIALQQNNIGNVIIPGVFSLLLALALMFGSISLINGFGEEKESRLIEVLFSSVSIRQLLIGKVLAYGSSGLLQVLIWLLSAPLLLRLASTTFGGLISGIQVPVNFLLLGLVYFVLGYLLFAVLSISIGAISSNAREGGQLSMIYTLTSFAPLWFSSLLFALPESIIWVVLTIFPITAPIQTMLRLGVTDIPVWQIAVSLSVLALSVALGLYLSIKIFRVHMLLHGKRPKIGEIIRSLKKSTA